MKTEVTDHSPTRKELRIEIEAERVRAEMERASDRYARHATVSGFRKGHAPRQIVRQRFRNEIRTEVLREIVPQAVTDAITESGLNVIGEPDVHLENEENLNNLGEAALQVHAHVEVLPEIVLGEYKNLEVERRVRRIREEDVDAVIENLRESSATLAPVEDRGAEAGDTVTVDFEGRYTGAPEDEPIKAEDVDVVLGGEGVLADFNERLTGVRPEDVRTFTIKYPEDFSSLGLAGKEIEYTARVTAVRRKEVPELNDEWARSLNEDIETLDRLRERLRETLTESARAESEQQLRSDVMRALIAAHQFEVPETLIQYQSQLVLESAVRDMMRLGLDPRHADLDWDALRTSAQTQAVDGLRGSMLLESVADAEEVTVSDEEIEAEIEALAEASRQTPEAVRAALTKQGGDRSIADRLRNRKALDLLVENARVTEEEWHEANEEEWWCGDKATGEEQTTGTEGDALENDESETASEAAKSGSANQ